MPKMVLKQESRLNGVKTNVFNIEDVASALRVPSKAIMKYLCSELGANMEQASIIKGKHAYDVMLKHLDKFIEKYVICKNCKYPELMRFIEGKNDLKSKCNSCGHSQSHDAMHQAGKVLINHLKQGKQQIEDIQKKDDTKTLKEEEEPEDDSDADKKKKKDKKEKKDKKDKKDKKKKNKEETKSQKSGDESGNDVSDLDDELTYTSKRISKSLFYPRKWSTAILAIFRVS